MNWRYQPYISGLFFRVVVEGISSDKCWLVDDWPVVNLYISMERSTTLHGKTHELSLAIFNIDELGYKLPNRINIV